MTGLKPTMHDFGLDNKECNRPLPIPLRSEGEPKCKSELMHRSKRRARVALRLLDHLVDAGKQRRGDNDTDDIYTGRYMDRIRNRRLSSRVFCGCHHPEGRRGTPAVVAGGGGSALQPS